MAERTEAEKLAVHDSLIGILVRQLHSERVFNGDGYSWSVCAECRQAWPCATERAIRGVLAIPDASGGPGA